VVVVNANSVIPLVVEILYSLTDKKLGSPDLELNSLYI
jgi:hypothetical protein